MNSNESIGNSSYSDQIHMAEAGVSEFIIAVTELFGPEQARLSVKDWLDEPGLLNSPPRSYESRVVTVATSARLANRLTVALRRTPLVASTDTKILPITSSNCFASTLLV